MERAIKRRYVCLWVLVTALFLMINLITGQEVYASTDNGRLIKMEVASSNAEYYQKVAELIKTQTRYIKSKSDDEAFGAARIIVKTRQARSFSNLAGVVCAVGNHNHEYVIQFAYASQAKSACNLLQGDPMVEYAEPDKLIHVEAAEQGMTALGTPGRLSSGSAYIGTKEYSDYVAGRTSNSLTVAVVDSGIDLDHPFFEGHLVKGYDFVGEDARPNDGNGHGTHVSGIILDNTGNTNIKLLPVRVLDNKGIGYMSIIATGIRYAADHKADLINLSLGGTHSSFVESAVVYALGKNIICVGASGNDGSEMNMNCCPGHMNKMITVGSIGNDGVVSGFSNYGSQLDFVAPGESIYSTYLNGSYHFESGTSMAVAHITACAALVRLMNPSYTPAQVELVLKSVADRAGKHSNRYGYGCVDMKKLMNGVLLPCVHNMTQKKIVKATTGHSGEKAHFLCSSCGKRYADQYGDQELFDADLLIPAIGNISLRNTQFTYTGSRCVPDVKVQNTEGKTIAAKYITVTCRNNLNCGTATAVIQFSGKYSGTVRKTFEILRQDLSSVKLKKSRYTYTGKAVSLQLKSSRYALVKARDYRMSTKTAPSTIGIYHVDLTGIGNFKGKKRITFAIVPKKPVISQVTFTSGTVKVFWKMNQSEYDRYEVQYSTDLYFKKNVITKCVRSKYDTCRFEGIPARGKRFFRMRGYKIVNKKKIYSDWSKISII